MPIYARHILISITRKLGFCQSNIRKPWPFIMPVLCACFCQSVLAFSFGNINVQSYLGESFTAHVNVSLGSTEAVEENCFNIVPVKTAEGVGGFLPSPRLKYVPAPTPNPTRGTVTIETVQSINEPAIQFILEANCPSVGAIQREYVVLLDPAVLSVPLSPATHLTNAKASRQAARPNSSSTASKKGKAKRGTSISNGTKSTGKKTSSKTPSSVVATTNLSDSYLDADSVNGNATTDFSPKVQTGTAVQPQEHGSVLPAKSKQAASKRKTTARGDFLLKLSAPEIDLSHSERMTEKERAEIREQQLLMDADDYVASLLASKNKLKELEGRIADLQLKMGPNAIPPAGSTSVPVSGAGNPEAAIPPKLDETATTPGEPANAPSLATPAPLAETKKPESETPAALLAQHWHLVVIGLIAVIVIISVLRRRRNKAFEQQHYEYELNEPTAGRPTGTGPNTNTGTGPTTGAAKTIAAASMPQSTIASLDDLEMLDLPSAPEAAANPKDLYRNVIINQFPELKSAGNTEARTIINVAWQYFEDRGERSRAIELIEFGLEEHPDVDELWLTQFEFLLRDKRRSAYEQLAKRYRQRFPSDQSWIKIQSWIQIQSGGRYLDPENLLYAVEAIAENDSNAKVLSLDFSNGENAEGEKDDGSNAVVDFSPPPKK